MSKQNGNTVEKVENSPISRRNLLRSSAALLALGLPGLRGSAWAATPEPVKNVPGYQRLFPDLPIANFDAADLARLASGDGADLTGMTANPETMKDKDKAPKRNDKGHLIVTATPETEQDDEENFGIPAGYTYLGQFIDHDLTFNPVDHLGRPVDAAGLHNMRTASFDLDSLYGRGPDDQPYLYQADGRSLHIGRALANGSGRSPAHDHPRVNGGAMLGDKRNDENVLVSQIHGLFAAFHNQVVKDSPNASFSEVRQIVTRHYQWVVLTDFLPRIVGPETMKAVLPGFGQNGRSNEIRPQQTFTKSLKAGEMPLEFADAAYRFGHSMIRPAYRLNRRMQVSEQEKRENPGLAGRRLIFAASQYGGLNGFREYPGDWGIDWRLYFEIDRELTPARIKDGPRRVQPSYKIDTSLVNPLAFLPEFSHPAGGGDLARDTNGQPRPKTGHMANLALRNLMRGAQHGLPSGQDVARAMGLEPIPNAELFVGKATVEGLDENKPLTAYGKSFEKAAPLWFYVLAEAQHGWERKARAMSGSKEARDAIPSHLGPVGGRLVAEVFVALMALDTASILHAGNDWQPRYAKNGRFAMSELIVTAGLA